MSRILQYALLGVLFFVPAPAGATERDSQKLRIIIETDAGGDPDDEQSLAQPLRSRLRFSPSRARERLAMMPSRPHSFA